MNRSGLMLSISVFMSPYFAGAQKNTLKPDKPNVLFISVDDLRPELGQSLAATCNHRPQGLPGTEFIFHDIQAINIIV